MTVKVDPALDSVDHINIYSRGLTDLGIWLSNFTRTAFIHPEFGEFQSMEGFYFYVGTGLQHEHLRGLYGFEAKKVGTNLQRVIRHDFMEIMESGCRAKVRCNGHIKEAIKESTLPFKHYYVFGNPGNWKVNEPKQHQWLVDVYETIRQELKQGVFQ